MRCAVLAHARGLGFPFKVLTWTSIMCVQRTSSSWSKYLSRKTFVGTPAHMAPEVMMEADEGCAAAALSQNPARMSIPRYLRRTLMAWTQPG